MTPENVKPYNDSGDKGKQVEQMFDSIASAYDFMNTAMSFGLHRYWRNHALKTLRRRLSKNDSAKPLRILDVACGTGDVTFALTRRLPGASVTGVDLSDGMLDVARAKLIKMDPHIRDAVSFQQADGLHLPFDDNSFDAVTVAYGVRNFENLPAGYAEMLRVLKPGGVICIIELSVPQSKFVRWGYNIYSRHLIPGVGRMVSGDARAYTYLPESIAACPQRKEMCRLMTDAGFADATWEVLTMGTVCIYFASKKEK